MGPLLPCGETPPLRMFSGMISMALRSVSRVSEPVLSAAEPGIFYESDRPTKNALEKNGLTRLERKGSIHRTSISGKKHLTE